MMTGLEQVDKVLERLDYRAKSKVNLDLDYISDLGIQYHEAGGSKSKAGYYARIDNRDMRLTDGAIKTACRMVKISDPRFFNQFEDRTEFQRVLYNGIDKARKGPKGALVRHNGLEVQAILPRDYKIKDANELLADFIDPLKDNLGEPQGIYSLEQGWGDHCSYRVIMGNNLLPDVDPAHGQYLMFLLSTSEHGLSDTSSTLGLYRTICTNSAIREQSLSRWDHKASAGKFYDDTASVIMQTGFYTDRFGQLFNELLQTPLDVEPADLVAALKANKLITKAHFDNAKLALTAKTEDGRDVENQYDLFNKLTQAARDLPSIQARERAEQVTLDLFTQPGGIREALRIAAENVAADSAAQSLLN